MSCCIIHVVLHHSWLVASFMAFASFTSFAFSSLPFSFMAFYVIHLLCFIHGVFHSWCFVSFTESCVIHDFFLFMMSFIHGVLRHSCRASCMIPSFMSSCVIHSLFSSFIVFLRHSCFVFLSCLVFHSWLLLYSCLVLPSCLNSFIDISSQLFSFRVSLLACLRSSPLPLLSPFLHLFLQWSYDQEKRQESCQHYFTPGLVSVCLQCLAGHAGTIMWCREDNRA